MLALITDCSFKTKEEFGFLHFPSHIRPRKESTQTHVHADTMHRGYFISAQTGDRCLSRSCVQFAAIQHDQQDRTERHVEECLVYEL